MGIPLRQLKGLEEKDLTTLNRFMKEAWVALGYNLEVDKITATTILGDNITVETIIGGTDSEDNLYLKSTSHETKGRIILDDGSQTLLRLSGNRADGLDNYQIGGIEFYNSNASAQEIIGRIQLVEQDNFARRGKFRIYTSCDGNETLGISISDVGYVGIGVDKPDYGLDIAREIVRLRSALTDNTTKIGRLVVGHYDNEEEGLYIFGAASTSSENYLAFGGGSTSFNAATQIDFYTAPDNVTLLGTSRLRIQKDGIVNLMDSTLKMGTYAAKGAEAFTGYITIQDKDGNDRKVMICA